MHTRRASLEALCRHVSGALQRTLLVEHHLHGKHREEIGHLLFIVRYRYESSLAQFRQDPDRDAARDINSAARHHAYRKIPRLRTVYLDPQIHRVDANRAFPRESALRNRWGGIGV